MCETNIRKERLAEIIGSIKTRFRKELQNHMERSYWKMEGCKDHRITIVVL